MNNILLSTDFQASSMYPGLLNGDAIHFISNRIEYFEGIKAGRINEGAWRDVAYWDARIEGLQDALNCIRAIE